MRRADPHRALLRALSRRYPGLLVLASQSEPWASATFIGARHLLTCSGPKPDRIAETEFELPGHFVADITARQDGDRVTIEALTIEAA